MRRLRRIPSVLALLVVGAVLASPWWIAVPVRRILAGQGVTFERYERPGLARMALTNVRFARPGAGVFTAARIEADMPLLLLLRRQFSRPGPVRVENWRYTLPDASAADSSGPDTAGDWMRLRARLGGTRATLAAWVPALHASGGEIAWPSGSPDRRIHLPAVVCQAGGASTRLDARSLAGFGHTADAVLDWQTGADTLALDLVINSGPSLHFLDADRAVAHAGPAATPPLRVSLVSTADRLACQFRFQNQTATLTARFAHGAWLPAEAAFDLPALTVPADALRLGSDYARVDATARIDWRDHRFTATLNARGIPASVTANPAPPLGLALRAGGDTALVSIDRLDLSIPGASAHLDAPIVVGYDWRLRSGASRFTLESDLALLPWLDATGRLTGEIVFAEPDAVLDHPLRLQARLQATALRFRAVDGITVTKADIDLNQDGSRTRVARAELALSDGNTVHLAGDYDHAGRVFSNLSIRATLIPAALARHLPAGALLDFENASLDATLNGPLASPDHQGALAVSGLHHAPLKPLNLRASWTGRGLSADADVVIHSADTEIRAAAKITPRHADLLRLDLRHAGAEVLRLEAPARLAWTPAFGIDSLTLAAPAGSAPARVALRFAPGPAPEFSLSAASLDSGWFTDLIDLGPARLQLASADLSGNWRQDAPLSATLKAAGQVVFSGSHAATIVIDAKTVPGGIDITDFSVSEKGAPIATAAGRVPLVLYPRQTPAWRIDADAPFQINAGTVPSSPFWQTLAAAAGITLEAPSLHAGIAGSWKALSATMDVSIGRLELDPARWPANNLPPVTGLAARLSVAADAINLSGFTARLAGQPVRAGGRILAPQEGWPALLAGRTSDFLRLPRELHLELPDTDVAALAPYSSDLLIPRGRLAADLHLHPDGSADGTIRLRNGALRPVGPLGAVRDIEIESRVSGRSIEITRATALVGGEPVALSGSATFRPGALPALDLAFKGKNIPFVRRSGFLVRGDIDLRARTGDDNATRLTGDIMLRDSLFLSDIRALWPDTPGGGPASRPPFFSIGTHPFNDWRLDINVRGDRFLRLRTTLATGLLSAGFQLGGTLGEPRSIGELTLSEGRILLPFATFSVGTGRIRITQAAPFTPGLDLRATGVMLGYDLTMTLSGSPDDPRLGFSSSPPLSSAEILLLVMAGRSPDDDFNYTGQQRAVRLGTYLGQGILEQFLGLDVGEERLSLTSGDKVTQQGRETYRLEYKIDKRWTAVGEYDEFDDYNIGLKWRFYQSKPLKENPPVPAHDDDAK